MLNSLPLLPGGKRPKASQKSSLQRVTIPWACLGPTRRVISCGCNGGRGGICLTLLRGKQKKGGLLVQPGRQKGGRLDTQKEKHLHTLYTRSRPTPPTPRPYYPVERPWAPGLKGRVQRFRTHSSEQRIVLGPAPIDIICFSNRRRVPAYVEVLGDNEDSPPIPLSPH